MTSYANLKLMLFVLVFCLLAATLVRLPKMLAHVSAQKAAVSSPDIAIQAAGRGRPWLNLQDGRDIPSADVREHTSAATLASGDLKPLSLAAGDLNADGYDDLANGYGSNGRGSVTLHWADPEAMSPKRVETFRGIGEGRFPEPFLSAVTVLELPVAPDFLGVGDFDFDNKADVLAAAKGDNAFYLLSGNSRGDFQPARRIEVDGMITTLATGQFSSGLVKEVAVGLATADGWEIVVYGIDAADGLSLAKRERQVVGGEVTSLAFGQLDDFAALDLAAIADGKILILHGQTIQLYNKEPLSPQSNRLESVGSAFRAKTLALGDFIWDRNSRSEIAALSSDGTAHILTRGQLDTRLWTQEELRVRSEQFELEHSSQKKPSTKQLDWTPGSSTPWQAAETLSFGVNAGEAPANSLLMSAHMSDQLSDDLVALDPQGRQLQVAVRPNPPEGGEAARQNSEVVTLGVNGSPIAALPMRLNAMGQSGLIVMRAGVAAAAQITVQPQAVVGVTNTNDSGAGSLRAAIAAAQNGDTINASGITGTITLSSQILIDKHITIMGPAAGTLTVSGNNSVRVFYIAAPAGGTVSMSRLTIANARSTGGAAIDAGAGIRVSSGVRLTLDNCTFSNNTDGNACASGAIGNFNGGPLTLTNCTFTGNSSFENGMNGCIRSRAPATFTNCTFSNNQALGFFGIAAIVNHGTMTMTNCAFTDNQSKIGAVWSDDPLPTSLMFAGCTFTGNSGETSGGIRGTNATISLNDCTLSNNAGGAINNVGSTTLTNCIFSGNSAGTGGGFYGSGPLNITGCTFSNNISNSSGFDSIGGAINAAGNGNITNCTFNNNSANEGGAVYSNGTLNLNNCTFFGNSAPARNRQGSAVGGSASFRITNCTLSGNNGVSTIYLFSGGALLLTNSILAGNSVEQGDIFSYFGGPSESSFSLIGNGDGSGIINGANGNLVGTGVNPINPLLGPLGNYGGSTQTVALLPGSPAINAGTNTGAPLIDQRGIARPQQGTTDMGAFETPGFTLAIAGGNNQSANAGATLVNPFSVTVASPTAEPIEGGFVTFTPPASGASCTVAGNRAMIVGGTATSGIITTNSISGSYTVLANASGAAPGNLSVTNGAPCPASTLTNPSVTSALVGIPFSQTFTQTLGVAPVIFSLNSGTLPAGFTLSTDGVLSGTPTAGGTFPITVKATDANRCFTISATYTLVITCPAITVTNPPSPFVTIGTPFNQTFTQTLGVGSVTFSLNSGTLPSGLTLAANGTLSGAPVQGGTFSITVKATDANNCVGIGATYTLQIGKASSTITITNATAISTPTVVGETYTVQVNLSTDAPGVAAPSGIIVISDGDQTCTFLLPATATSCNLISTGAGPKMITASYTGDSNYVGSTSEGVPHLVNKADTTTIMTSDFPDPSDPGQNITVVFRVTAVAPSTGTPTGTVTISDGVDSCVRTVQNGSCNFALNTPGTRTLTATFAANGNYNGSSATPRQHTVTGTTTTTTITNATALTGTPTVIGEAYAVNFSVTAAPPVTLSPTGTVTVSDGTQTATVTLPATTCNLISTSVGAKTITVTFNGSSGFGTSSTTASHTVNKANTTVSITNIAALATPTVVGQPYTVAASASVNSPGGGTATGTITVSDGSQTATITLPATSCSLISTSSGARTITATYNGDANFNGSTSASLSHPVNKANTTTTITYDNPDPSPVGQNVTVNFMVAATAPGAGTPTGNVTISDGVNSCTGTVANGSCTLVLTTPGNRTLTATYAGDSNFNGSSDTESHAVAAPPVINMAFSPASVPIGATSTLTLTITNPAVNTVALTGVSFTNNFPANLVVAAPLTATTTCGGTLQDASGGLLNAGDTGIRFVGGTVAIAPGNTCTVSVQVTPNAAGPFNNVTGSVTSTNGGTGNTTSATLSTNTPPSISSNTFTLKAGSSAASFTIGSAADPNQSANTLGLTINGGSSATSNGITVNNLAITTSGVVSAQVSTTCAAQLGNTTFNLVVTDSQSATGSGMLTVAVTPETTKPVIVCNNLAAQTANADANCSANVPDIRELIRAQASDNCTPNASLTVTQSPTQGNTVSGAGSHPITVTVTDESGNSETCVVSFTINDTQPPVITCPSNKTLSTDPNQCSATVAYANPVVSDGCSGAGVPQCSPPSGSAFPKGTITVTCTVSDASGNQSVCSFTVTVNDLQTPSMACPANVSVPAGQGQCSAVITYPAPMVSDNCPGVGVPVCAPPSGSTFAKGTTTVTCTVRDVSNNQSSCSFGVTVVDTQPPTIACPANLITNTINPGDATVGVSFTATATDNCSGGNVACIPPSGSQFPTGTTTVTCTASDISNNQATCSFTIQVFDYVVGDDPTGKILRFNSLTGDYDFLDCSKGTSLSGRGVVTKTGCKVDLKHTGPSPKQPDRNLSASANYCMKTGVATITYAGVTHTLNDPNLSNNISKCP